MNFLHGFSPSPIALELIGIKIYWYGLLIAIGAFLAYMVYFFITKKILKSSYLFSYIENLIVYLIIFGFIGARLYHVLARLPYYLKNPIEVFYVWQGGLGIFGGIIGGIIVLYFYNKKKPFFKNKYKSFLRITDILAPGIILAQAIGRWGNYFNSELFGSPVSWGIPIPVLKRPSMFKGFEYFQPTFLYESLWNLIVFLILILLVVKFIKKRPGLITGSYLMLYSLGRFVIEFFRIDSQPQFLGLRMAQIFCLGLIIVAGFIFLKLGKLKLSNS
ncbi:MAG TPA: prolipoprotein diacylglyceryl transferase [Patescibacteria group bacterium]|nr:prolipoprotein diacylglyceryl transferase [Patescibacteria group bacterium]